MRGSPSVSATLTNAAETYADAEKLLANRDLLAAVERLETAEELGYDFNECAAAKWQCWMLLGKFENAWEESDKILASGGRDSNRFWDGSSWSERRVILRCLHGLGDTIQFIRYAPMLRDTCRSLTVQTHPELVRLLKGVAGIDRVISWGPSFPEDHSDWDMQIEVTELPFAFRTTLATIPGSVPYIVIPDAIQAWAIHSLGVRTALRVALVWESGPYNPQRSIPPNLVSVLPEVCHCQFYCLHKSQDKVNLAHFPTFINIISDLDDVLVTASLLSQMDLVITVDTMVAHLAGAINVPTWIMLPASADWRWLIERDTSPWYPSARLFRQKQAGEWTSVLRDVRQELVAFAHANSSAVSKRL